MNVYKEDRFLGTLSGVLASEIKEEDVLTLKFLSPDYAHQDGTIEYIAAHCDYTEASVKVQSVEGTSVTYHVHP